MAVTIVMLVIGVCAVSFMLRFLIALCYDKPVGKCHLVRLLRNPEGGLTTVAPVRMYRMPAHAAGAPAGGALSGQAYSNTPANTVTQERRA